MVLALFCWLIMAFQYSFVELYRPFIVCAVIVFVSILLALVYGVLVKNKIRKFINFGILVGINISLLFFISNFLIKQPVDTNYEIISVNPAKANAKVWYIKISNNLVKLSVQGYPSEQEKLEIFKGLWGYYYGNKIYQMTTVSIPDF